MRVNSREYQGKQYTDVQASRIDTKGKILDFTDGCFYDPDKGKLVEKVQWNLVDYEAQGGTVATKHWMDLDDFMVLAYDIFFRLPVKFTDMKGSRDEKYPTGYESRVLSVEHWAEAQKYKDVGGAYTITIKNGPGKQNDSGAVQPAGEPTKVAKIVIGMPDARRAFLDALNYFQARRTAFLALNWHQLFPNSK